MWTHSKRQSEDLCRYRRMGCEASRCSEARPLFEMREAGSLHGERASRAQTRRLISDRRRSSPGPPPAMIPFAGDPARGPGRKEHPDLADVSRSTEAAE